MMKKKWRAAALCLCAAMLTWACSTEPESQKTVSGQEEPEEKEETAEEIAAYAKQLKLDAISPSAYGNIDGLELEAGTYFSVIGKGSSEEYWSQVKAGAEAAVADLNEALGYEGSDKIKVVYSAPSKTDDVDGQVNVLDEELARYPSALGIAVIDTKSCNVQFDLATQNGIPIVTFDSLSSCQGVMAHVGTDNEKAAAEAADHMAEALGEEGQVLVFGHDSKSVSSRSRVENFAAEIQEQYPNMSVTETYYMDQLEDLKKEMAKEQLGLTEEDTATEGDSAGDGSDEETVQANAAAIAEAVENISDEEVYVYLLEQNPEVKGIYATNGTAVMHMVDLCEDQEREDIVIMGYDGDQDELQAVRDGKVAGLIIQNPYGMGYATIVAEARSILEIGNEAQVDTGYTWVTGDNIDEKDIARMLQ